MKTFDILKKPEFVTEDVQKNLKLLHKEYGSKFNIKYNKYILPVKLIFDERYKMIYDIKNRTIGLYPFKIEFWNLSTKSLDSTSYISDIYKTESLSGSVLIQIVLQINRILNVKTSYLTDTTWIKCKQFRYDLSYVKLLEKNRTFYMKFGFEFDTQRTDYFKTFKSPADKYNYVIQVINKCKKIKNADIKKLYLDILNLLHTIIKEQTYSKLKIQNKHPQDQNNYWFNEEIDIDKLYTETKSMLELLSNVKEQYIYKTIINLFNDKEKCDKLNLIDKYIINGFQYNIIYAPKGRKSNTTISYKLIEPFRILKALRTGGKYVYNY
jgi:hypothetical protein